MPKRNTSALPIASLSRYDGNAASKTSLENKNLGNGDYFVIIASSSHPLLLTEHATNGLGKSAVEVNIENGRFTEIGRAHV